MKPLSQSPWKQRCLYFFAGAILGLICGFIQFMWMEIVPYTNFMQQPGWLKALKIIVGWFPWIVFLVVLIFRFFKGNQVRVLFHFLGTALGSSVLPVLIIGLLILGPIVDEMKHAHEFNPELWRNHEEIMQNPKQVKYDIMWPPRQCMVDDLIESGQLDGLTEEQVIDLLGQPDDRSYFGETVNCDIYYYLGPERGFGVDSDWLFITFGEDGKMERYWITSD